MKHIWSTLLMTLVLAGQCGLVYAVPTLSINSKAVEPGSIFSTDINLSGGLEAYGGLNVIIILPERTTLVHVAKGKLLTAGNFIVDYQTHSDNGTNAVTIIAYSATDYLNEVAGVLLSLEIQTEMDILPGSYEISFAATNKNQLINSRYALASANGSISIEPAIKSGTLEIILDTDSDGLSDIWEQLIVAADPNDEILGIGDVHPRDDFDGDRFSNLREWLSGTDATSFAEIPPCLSDYQWDGDVDGEDGAWFAKAYGRDDCSVRVPCDWDLNGDNLIDDLDLLFVSEDFGRTDCAD